MTSIISKRMQKLFSAQVLGLVTCFALMLIGPKPANATTALDFTGTSQNGFQAALTFGWSFSVTETIGADGLGFFDDFLVDGRGLQQDHRIRLWTDEATPVLLAETIITNASTPVASTASDGQWMFNDIGFVLLTPGRYVLGADDPQCGGPDCDRIRFQDSAATIPQITFLENRDASPIGFPASSASGRNDGYFGPTFRATAVPEPATGCLLAIALGFCVAISRRRTMSIHGGPSVSVIRQFPRTSLAIALMLTGIGLPRDDLRCFWGGTIPSNDHAFAVAYAHHDS